MDLTIGAIVAGATMAGDLFSSFVKRRLNLPPSSQALGLDQVPESLFPMLACRDALSLTIADIALGVGIFFIGELILSRLLYQVHLRDEPYHHREFNIPRNGVCLILNTAQPSTGLMVMGHMN
jgi:CDP-archaeol synthase